MFVNQTASWYIKCIHDDMCDILSFTYSRKSIFSPCWQHTRIHKTSSCFRNSIGVLCLLFWNTWLSSCYNLQLLFVHLVWNIFLFVKSTNFQLLDFAIVSTVPYIMAGLFIRTVTICFKLKTQYIVLILFI